MNDEAERASDQGQIMLLTLAFAALALTLVLVVASASAVHIERKRLIAFTDSVAAAAADALDEERYYAGDDGGVPRVLLTDASVRAAVDDHLATAPPAVPGEFEGLRVVEPTGSPDGRTAQVTFTARVRPPLVPAVLTEWADGIALRVTSTARAQ